MTLPVLRTDRMILEPLGEQHLEHLVELDSDPEVLRYLYSRPRTRAEVEAAMERRTNPEAAARGLGYWCGFIDGDFVGWWLLVDPDRAEKGDPGDGVLGYRLLRRRWRQGLASEGSREILRYAFEDLGVPRVTAETMATNLGSQDVMRSIGMSYWHTFHDDWEDPLPDADQGEVVYAISREEWLAQAGGV